MVGGFGCQDRLCHCQTAGITWCTAVIKGKWDYRGNGVYSLSDRFTDPHRIEYRSRAMKVIICGVNYLWLETTCFDNPQFPSPSLITCVQPYFLSPFSLGFLYLPPSLQGRTLKTEICHCSATRFSFIILFSLYFFPVQWSVRQTTSNTATLSQTWPRKYITAQFLWLHQNRKKGKNLNIAGGFISETLLVFPEQQHIEVRRKCTESAALKLSSVFISLGQFRRTNNKRGKI